VSIPPDAHVGQVQWTQTFADLASAVDDAFARWDRAHLHMFDLGDPAGLLIDQNWEDPHDESRVDDSVKLGVLKPGQQFVYVFDLGDNWTHLCTVGAERIDPMDTLGVTPQHPTPYWGWARFRTNTADNGTATTAIPRNRRIPTAPLCAGVNAQIDL
jgi:hypothetical protein